MTRANYIIFHPDYARERVSVEATSIVGKKLFKRWQGYIWVDAIGNGNEDPYVFNNGWIYSYCHASQLRRKPSKNYLQPESLLVFCSGDKAEDGILCVDTVFEVGEIHEWSHRPHLSLPNNFSNVKKSHPELWNRHFKFPFKGHHSSVTHTYEAQLGIENSFIPLFSNERVCVDFDDLPRAIRNKISSKLKAKYPVILNDSEISQVVQIIRKKSDTQVLKDIRFSTPRLRNKMKSGC
jgi:hypothetical protein